MKKEEKELQSRRDFFKKAAKTALPILGAIVLASSPVISKAAVSMSCETTCSGVCRGNCHYTCRGTCRTSCEDRCDGTCEGTCKFSSSGR